MTDVKHFIFVSLSHCLIVSARVSRLTSHVKPRHGDAMALHATPKVSVSQRLAVSARVSCLASHVKPRHGNAIAPHATTKVSPSRRLAVSAHVSRLASHVKPRHGDAMALHATPKVSASRRLAVSARHGATVPSQLSFQFQKSHAIAIGGIAVCRTPHDELIRAKTPHRHICPQAIASRHAKQLQRDGPFAGP